MWPLLQTALPFFAIVVQAVSGQTRAPDKNCSLIPLDLVFVVDSSGSIGTSSFRTGLRNLAAFTNQLAIGLTKDLQSRVGFVRFSDTPVVIFNFSRSISNEFVYDAILSTYYDGGGTLIADGMAAAIDGVFSTDRGWRGPSANNILLLITDGNDSTNVAMQSQRATTKGIVIYAVAIGDGVDYSQLLKATGSSSRIFNITDLSQLETELGIICQNITHIIASSISFPNDLSTQPLSYGPPQTTQPPPNPQTTAPPAPAVSTAPPQPRPSHHSRPCTGNLSNIWLDVVALVDSTRGAGYSGFSDILGFLSDAFGTVFPVSQNPRYTRFGIINIAKSSTIIANLTSFLNGIEVQDAISKIPYENAKEYNLTDALGKAQTIFNSATADRPNAKKVAIVFSSIDVVCPLKVLQEWRTLPVASYCRIVGQFVENGWYIIGVGVKYFDTHLYPKIHLGFPCYETRNDNKLFENVANFLVQINCFCLSPNRQFIDGPCQKYGECVHLEDVPTGYTGAHSSCTRQGGTLTDIYTSAKETFLAGLAASATTSSHNYFPFWSGFRRTDVTQPFLWDNGAELQSNDYSNWDIGQPTVVPGGDCGVVTQGVNGTSHWQVKDCRISTNSFNYFCQTDACDTDNYCP